MVVFARVAEGAAEIQLFGVVLQRAGAAVGALADDVGRREEGLENHGLNLRHAHRVDVHQHHVGDVLGSDVAVVGGVGVLVVGAPDGVFEASGTFLVAGLEDYGALVEEGPREVVEVVLVSAAIGAGVEQDARQLGAGRRAGHRQPAVDEQLCGGAHHVAHHGGEGGIGRPEVRHLAAVGEGEEAVFIVDGAAEFRDKGVGAQVLGNGILAFDACKKSLHAGLGAATALDVVVAALHLQESRADGKVGAAVGGGGVEVSHHEGHVVVAHVAHEAEVEALELGGAHVAAVFILAVECLEARQVAVVGGVPVDGVDVPEDIARAHALPQVLELAGVGVVGQLAVLAREGHIVGILAAAAGQDGQQDKEVCKDESLTCAFHCGNGNAFSNLTIALILQSWKK